MQYATQLLFLILGGVFLAQWLEKTYGWPEYWTIILPVAGLFLGLLMIYKQTLAPPPEEPVSPDAEKNPEKTARHD